VAIASAIIASSSFITVLMVKRILPISFIDQVWRQLAAAGLMFLVLMRFAHLWSGSILWLLIGVLAGAFVYGTIMLIFGYNKLKRELVSLRKNAL
jgi:hypothetical protein